MLTREVAKRYASALFILGKEKNLVSDVYDQLAVIADIVEREDKFLDFLKSPRAPENDKKEFVKNVLGGKIHPMLLQFFDLLIEKGRIGHLKGIIDEFNRKVEAERGIGRATVITATKLNADEEQKLIENLSAKLDLKIVLETEIKPEIMGGVIVITHDQIIDGSIRHGLDLIEQSLSKVRVA